MHVRTHPDTDVELEEATFFYEKRSAGLGDDLLYDFEQTIQRIVAAPTRYRKIYDQIRQVRLRRFPFNIVYEVSENIIYILAFSHLRRRPFYWQNRTISQ